MRNSDLADIQIFKWFINKFYNSFNTSCLKDF